MKRFDHRKYRRVDAMPMPDRQWPNRRIEHAPQWASVDLRDGNQALLEPMSVARKQRLWKLLVGLGLKQIEVGFPAASQADHDFLRWLIEQRQVPADVTIQVLTQAREALIERTFEALVGVKQAIVHVYNSTSTVQRERVFGLSRDGVRDIAVQGARWLREQAARYPDTDWTFEYSPESFSNTEWDYAVEVCDAVMVEWQASAQRPCIINLPATVESSTPNLFADQVEYFCAHLARRDAAVISVHTHNDRGSAVAAAELALLAGADRVEGTLFGNGERTGNMDLVTLAMNLYSQGIDPELDLSNPDQMVAVYTEATGMPVHPRHPWVGELVYTAFSGSHQDAIRKCLHQQGADEPWQVAYLPIDPADIGRDYQAVIRVNSQSGKAGVAYVLERDYRLRLPRWMQVELAAVVQRESERCGGEVDSATIFALFQQQFVAGDGSAQGEVALQLQHYRIERHGQLDSIEARVEVAGGSVLIHGEGEGAISAFVDGWQRHCGQVVHIVDYSEHGIGEGTDAEAAAYVKLSVDGQRVAGAAFDHDTVSASLMALLAGIGRAQGLRRAA